MKKIILFVISMITVIICLNGQTLKHFNIKTIRDSWLLTPTFDEGTKSGFSGFWRDGTSSVNKLIKNAVRTNISEEIKQKIIKQPVWLDLYFNKKGEIFYMTFMLKKGDLVLTDEEWLKVYNVIHSLKIDVSKLDLLENFEWGTGLYPLNKYLQ